MARSLLCVKHLLWNPNPIPELEGNRYKHEGNRIAARVMPSPSQLKIQVSKIRGHLKMRDIGLGFCVWDFGIRVNAFADFGGP